MNSLFKQILQLLVLIGIITLLLTTGRVIFYFFNSSSFDIFSGSELSYAILKGIEYDFLTVIAANILFIFFFIWPSKIYNTVFYLTFLKILFFIINGTVLLCNLFDIRIFQLHGHRLRAFEIKEEVKFFFNEFQTSNINDLVGRYLSLTIYFFIFLIILWLCLKFIKARNIESKKPIVYYKWTSIVLLVGIIISLVFNNPDKTNWLTKLYLKVDKRLAPLVVNNPYLIICSARSEEIEIVSDWNIDKFNSIREYTSLKLPSYEDIKLVIIEKKELSETIEEGGYISLSSLNNGSGNIFQFLDEVLLSFPGIYDKGFYQSVYSLNSYENLLDILQRNGYSTRLSVVGYDEKVKRLIKNFYGFSNSQEKEVSNSNKKNFELVLINARDKENNVLFANTEMVDANSLIIRMEISFAKGDENRNGLVKSISFTTQDTLPFYTNPEFVITQTADIKPSILHLVGYTKPFTAYGNSLFQNEEKVIFQSISDSSHRIIMDSLLLKFSNNETIELKKLNKTSFSEFNFKDSLAVERIILENKIHAILRDYKLKLKNNSL